MQCACDIFYCHLWSDSTKFFRIISQKAQFSTKMFEYKMRDYICSKTFIRNISHSNMNEARYYRKYKVPVILVRLSRNLSFSRQIFVKYSNTKFNENPPSGR
jgi:hypothetical protein